MTSHPTGVWFASPRTSETFHAFLREVAEAGLWVLHCDDGLTVARLSPGLTYIAWPRQVMLVPRAVEGAFA